MKVIIKFFWNIKLVIVVGFAIDINAIIVREIAPFFLSENPSKPFICIIPEIKIEDSGF